MVDSCTSQSVARKLRCPGAVLWALAVCCLLYLFLRSGSSKPTLRLQRQNRSLAQAATLSRQLRELSLGQFSHSTLSSAFRVASQSFSASDYSSHSPDVTDSYQHTTEFKLLVDKASDVLSALSSAKPVTLCAWDPSMPLDLHNNKKVLLAANMHNNEDLLPHFTLQMLHLLASLPLGSAFLSVYESGSTDSTGAWLEVLRDLMACIGTPHRIVIGGSLMRGEQQDRIDFLAQARNRALEPLWLSAAALSDTSAAAHAGLAKEMATWDLFSARDTSNTMWHAQKIVFFNDVYFCAQDVFRLLQHKADMACGMDFDRPKIDGLPHPEQRRMFGWYLWHKYAMPRAIGRFLGRSGLITKHWRLDPNIQAAFQAKSTMGFYDTWVARDSDGNLFLKEPPYVTDPYSLHRIALGLPFPVKCCWNGLVVMSAAPFSQHNLRVRMHKEGECAASECSLVCNDLQRMGYRKIIVDPGVRQAYDAVDARDLYNNASVSGLPFATWGEVQAAKAIDWSLVPHRPFTQCCGLPEGHNMIEFDKDCFWDNFMYPNYTAMRPTVRHSFHF